MRTKIIIEGNSFYEIDLDCLRKQEERAKKENRMDGRRNPQPNRRNRSPE